MPRPLARLGYALVHIEDARRSLDFTGNYAAGGSVVKTVEDALKDIEDAREWLEMWLKDQPKLEGKTHAQT